MIDAFGGADSVRGNTGPFWVGYGLAVFSAIITFFFIKPLDTDSMKEEDRLVSLLLGVKYGHCSFRSQPQFREYLEANGYDTSVLGLESETSSVASDPEKDIKV